MKRIVLVLWLLLSFTMPTWAHHPAADIVDPDIYAMIDSLVADTPHADLVFTDMGMGMTEIEVTASSIRALETMIDNGLMDYALTLDGDVSVTIRANPDGGVTMTISQRQL
ncbi:MAG: hypothetical protein P8103_11210 [Candidatus Thiodiazotropha sp.]